jgi:hypothetical protein
MIVDVHGHSAVFFGSDSQSGLGTAGVSDGSALAKDLEPSQFGLDANRTPDYFHIIPEVDPDAAVGAIGTIKVQLIEQTGVEYFNITANQLKASAGQALPYRIKMIYKTGTTEDFSIIW